MLTFRAFSPESLVTVVGMHITTIEILGLVGNERMVFCIVAARRAAFSNAIRAAAPNVESLAVPFDTG
jgi:hypothetical protein